MHTVWHLHLNHSPHERETFRMGFARHLRYAACTTMLVQIGTAQQAYLVSRDCAGCTTQRCLPGCETALLRQLLRSIGITLTPVQHGLRQRPYTRLLLAWPGPHAHMLTGELLQAWPEARLCITYRHTRRLCAHATLAVGADGPNPEVAIQQHGWHTQNLPVQISNRTSLVPSIWPLVCEPQLLLPVRPPPIARPEQHQHPVSAAQEQYDPALLSRALTTLQNSQPVHAACADGTHKPDQHDPGMCGVAGDSAEGQTKCTGASGGAQCPIDTIQLSRLIGQILATPALHNPRLPDAGLSANRLQKLGLARSQAQQLLLWLDQAELLSPPVNPAMPWRTPRRLVVDDLAGVLKHL